MRQTGAATEGLTGDAGSGGTVLHPDSVNTQVGTLHRRPERCHYSRKVGQGTQDFSVLFLITTWEPLLILKSKG